MSKDLTQSETTPVILNNARYWCVVPAAGVGSRMGADKPKQYLQIHNKTVIEQTLLRLLEFGLFERIVVVISEQDSFWSSLAISKHPKVHTTVGGKERCDSVLEGLKVIDEMAHNKDWVLVHDAARPCVQVADIRRLVDTVCEPSGGLLGVPVKDTMKRTTSDHSVDHSVDRHLLWHAYTPQMFPVKRLYETLKNAILEGLNVTDEASAMEMQGFKPLMVEGQRDNIKITHPLDLPLAAWYLEQQGVVD